MFIELKKQELLILTVSNICIFSLENPETGIMICTCKKESSWTDEFFHYRIWPRGVQTSILFRAIYTYWSPEIYMVEEIWEFYYAKAENTASYL